MKTRFKIGDYRVIDYGEAKCADYTFYQYCQLIIFSTGGCWFLFAVCYISEAANNVV